MEITFLRNHPLTFGLRADQLQHLGTLLVPVALGPGEEVLTEGVPAKGLFMLREGRLRVSRKVGRTEPARTLAALEAPTVVGEMELVTAQPSAATVTAETAVNGALLTGEAFAQLVEAADPVVTKLLRNLARVLAARLGAMDRRVAELVPQRRAGDLEAAASDVRHAWNP